MDGTTGTEPGTSQRVTVAEAAAILGVSVVTVRRMIRRGQLEGERVVRPQGSAYAVTLPADATGAAEDGTPTGPDQAKALWLLLTFADRGTGLRWTAYQERKPHHLRCIDVTVAHGLAGHPTDEPGSCDAP